MCPTADPRSVLTGAAGTAVILSPNPMHDTGGGQRSAQLAGELLERDYAVLFVSHDVVTETTSLGLSFAAPRLVECALPEIATGRGRRMLDAFLHAPRAMVVTQVPVAAWLPVLRRARRASAARVFDLIDEWDSQLGQGWYRASTAMRIAAASNVLIATAPALQRDLERATGRQVAHLPNAFNSRIFDAGRRHPRPLDLPSGEVALYIGALWGGWMDWALVAAAAEALPAVAFVFIGDYRGEGGPLPKNVHFLGLKPQTALPPYLAHASVAIMPWTDDSITQKTSPLKLYEFLAMGLRVVAPATEPLHGIPGVYGANVRTQWIDLVGSLMRTATPPAEQDAMRAFIRRQDWTHRVDALLALTATASTHAPPAPFWQRLRDWIG